MAEKTLRLIFEKASNSNKTTTVSVPLCDDTKTAANIKSAMNVIYANREIFNLDMGEPKSAAFVTPLTLTVVDINS